MKKMILTLAIFGGLFTGCTTDDSLAENATETVQGKPIDMSDFYIPSLEVYQDGLLSHGMGQQKVGSNNLRRCYTVEVLNRQLKENPSLYHKMYDVELNTRKFLNANQKGDLLQKDGDNTTYRFSDNLGIINIPVYVHVVYSRNQENISNAQIQSQISVLNKDFRKQNADASYVPSEFAGLAADTGINFSLENTYRYYNAKSSWGTTDQVKYNYPPISPETHLNIWICNIGGGILGYAQFPGGSPSTDGVVISPQYFGTTGYVSAPYNKGRTATHEVGHYLNLRHIWGDGGCRQDDFVSDTPASDGANYGCPSYPTAHCRSNDMTMNYMDYTNDACMYMFSNGQKARMRSIFAYNGPRAAMANN